MENGVNGIMVARVNSLEDPLNLARVQVEFPLLDKMQSNWAKLVVLMGGKDRGTLFRPEVGDEVLIAFELGDVNRPYVLGGLWNKVDTPPAMGSPAKDNNLRQIRSRSGHLLRFDDKKGEEKVELIDKDNKRRIVLDVKNKKVQMISGDKDGAVEISAKDSNGKVQITADKSVELTCNKGDVSVKAKGTGKVSVESSGANVSVKASKGTVSVDGLTVNITAKGNMRLKANGQLTVQSSGILNLKGSMVNIN